MLTGIVWNNIKSHSFLVEMQNSEDTLENSFAISYRYKHALLYEPESCSLVLIQKAEMSIQNLNTMFIAASHNCQNLETTYMYVIW